MQLQIQSSAECEQSRCIAVSTSAPTAEPTAKPVPAASLAVKHAAASLARDRAVGDGECDRALNTAEFDFDQGDCCPFTCIPSLLYQCRVGTFDCKDPVEQYRYKEVCPVTQSHKNGKCDIIDIRNTAQCEYDGGDCCRDTCTGEACANDPEVNKGWYHCKDPSSKDLVNCHVKNVTRLGDGKCDAAPYNSAECNFDAGDCCLETCHGDGCGGGGGEGATPFDCKHPAFLGLGNCTVGHPEYIGDGWCDGADDATYISAACNFDGGDCCESSCRGSLCGQNGFDHCPDEALAELEAPDSDAAGRRVQESKVTEPFPQQRRRISVGGVVDSVVGNCGTELNACVDDAFCGRLFMVGSVTPVSPPLQELLKCIEDFDHTEEEGGNFHAYWHDMEMDGESWGLCVAYLCKGAYLECQMSPACFLGKDSSATRRLDACIEAHCVQSPRPTVAPTVRPTVPGKGEEEAHSELIFHIGGAGADSRLGRNSDGLRVAFKHITAGDMDVIPMDRELEGPVIVTSSCDLHAAGDANMMQVDLKGSFVIIKRGCNVYETARKAAAHGAVVLAFATDEQAASQWLPRDRMLTIPVLAVEYGIADSLQTMLRRGKAVRARLSSRSYCDMMHASGLDTSLAGSPVGGDSCCVAGDIVTSYLLFGYDSWHVGAREFSFCRRKKSTTIGDLDLAVRCADPAEFFGADMERVCGGLAKRNGVCEDGGVGSVGHSVAWGGDCQDCSPRILDPSEDRSNLAYGVPTETEFGEAQSFLCGTDPNGMRCQDALSSQYAEFHGPRNVYSAIVDTLCMDTKCALAGRGGLLQYDLGRSGGGGGGVSCCLAGQVFAAYLLENVFGAGPADLAAFNGLCENELGASDMFDFVCDDEVEVGGRNHDGTIQLLLQRRPRLTRQSFQTAQRSLCRNEACMGIAEDMLLDVRRQMVADGDGDGAGLLTVPALSHFPSADACGHDRLALCRLLPFVEYWAAERALSSATGTTWTCCEASSIVVAGLLRQASAVAFESACRALGSLESCGRLVQTWLEEGSLDSAKEALLLPEAEDCLASTWNLLEALKGSSHSSSLAALHHSGVLDHLTKKTLQQFVESSSICWLQWSIRNNKPLDMPSHGCAAADAVLSRHLRQHHAAIAPDVYRPEVSRTIEEEGPTTAEALSFICGHPGNASNLDALVRSETHAFLGRSPFSFETLCNDPCLCTAEVPGGGVAGCGYHERYAPQEKAYRVDERRPFCYVTDPLMCSTAVASTAPELVGQAWSFCSMEHATCQAYGGAGPCAPFIPSGVGIFVPAGETLESLQHISSDNAVFESLWENMTTGNLLEAWLLEAALVSPTSYMAHGQMICNSRLRRCAVASESGGAESGGSVLAAARPRFLCRDACTRALVAKFTEDEVFNDLLRKFDGVRFGALFGTDVVCDWTLLPLGFHATETVSGLDLAGSTRLQSVLGIDRLLQELGGSNSTFGKPVYPQAEKTGECFSFPAVDDASTFRGFDVEKALAQIRCPDRFVKNQNLNRPAEKNMAEGSSEKMCVGTCPSNAYADSDYLALWWIYVLPGSLALVLNLSAMACLALKNRVASRPGPSRMKSTDANTVLLIRLSVMSGLIGVAPVALWQENLVCDCNSELCFSQSFLCKLNQMSVYAVMSVVCCLLYKFAKLLHTLEAGNKKWERFVDRWWAMHLTWVMPTVLGLASFACEESGNDGFHLAKSAFRCQYRHGSLVVESLLLHVPMCLCMGTMCLFIRASVHICLETVLLQCRTRSLANIWKVLKSRPEMNRIFFIGILSFTLMLVWVVQTVLAGVLSHVYIEALSHWLACIRFDFARRNAAGEQWEELLVANSDGRLCPASPQGTTLFESQVLRSLFEVLIPGMVAITFGFRILHVDGGLLLQMSRATGTSAAAVAVVPLSFDSKAYDVPSGKQDSLRSRRDESGGVCHSVFLEPAKSGLGASKDAAESAVHAGCGESEYNSSGNARDSLQKVDKLSVAESTFENERLASLPPKPDGCNVVMCPSASTLSGPRASTLSGPRNSILSKPKYAW
jgi:hypothetical protein